MQTFANQFTGQTEQQIPTHYKELGNLIRQLSLCSAKLELDSSISDVILDILLQVEVRKNTLVLLRQKRHSEIQNCKLCCMFMNGRILNWGFGGFAVSCSGVFLRMYFHTINVFLSNGGVKQTCILNTEAT